MKKFFVLSVAIMLLMVGANAYAVTHNSSVNLDISVNADGYAIGGGTTSRTFTVTGAAAQLNATQVILGANTFTMPSATDTIVGRASSDSLTNKTLTSSTNTLGGVTMGLGTDAVGDTYYGGASSVLSKLVGNTSTTRKFMLSVGSGSAATAPSWDTLTSTDVALANVTNDAQVKRSEYTAAGDILVGTGSGTLGKVTIGNTGDVATVAGGTLTWAAPVAQLLPWTDVTGTTQQAAVNNGYIANNAALVTITLPATAAVGKIIAIVGKGAGGWKIAQNASQLINFGSVVTTTGATGYLSSTNAYDSIELVCVVANTTFVVRSSQGNITYN
jgi:hypothetical protein